MIKPKRFTYQVKKGNRTVTAWGGLALVAELAEAIGLRAELEEKLKLKQRRRGESEAESGLSLVLLAAAGGECLEDLRVLEGDKGLKQLVGKERFMAPNTAGEFLRRHGWRDLRILRESMQGVVEEVWRRQGVKQITLEVDAWFVAAEKEEAQMSYKGERGYMPLLAYIAELGMFWAGVFRPGNASPAGNAVSFLRLGLAGLPEGVEIYLRSDSAWYNEAVLALAARWGVKYAVTGEQREVLLGAAQRLPESAWQPLPESASGEEVAETSHVIKEKGLLHRVVIIRQPRRQLDLFEGEWSYYFIITNLEWEAARVVHWQRQRAASENAFKELKEGYGLRHLPCGTFLANAAWFHIMLLAYNLVRALQVLVLPESWHSYRVKNLRFRLLALAGWVVRHARRLLLYLSADYPFWEIFAQARWRLIGLAAE